MVVIQGPVTLSALVVVHADDLIAGGAEGVDVPRPYQLGDLHVGPVQGAQGYRAVGHQLHVAGAAGLLGGQGDLLGDVCGGDQPLRPGDVVVLHHGHPEPGAHLRVVLNQGLEAEDEVDDVLGHHIGWGGLGAEEDGDGPLREAAGLDLQVLVDDVQGVHLLALVLVEPLNLHVEDGIGVQLHPLGLSEKAAEALLGALLHRQQAAEHLGVMGVPLQLLQPRRVPAPAVADAAVDKARQIRIAGLQPAAEGDAVGLVVEFAGVERIEGPQLRALENLRVQGGHAVDGKAVVDVHVGHVDQLLLVQNGRLLVGADLPDPPVQLQDDGRQQGGDLLDKGQGPFLQGLRQDGVVGVGAGPADLVDGLVHGQAPLGEQADQLRDDHGGVGVVDLDDHVVRQLLQAVAPLPQLLEDQLGPGGDHEVLLVHPQQPALLVPVVGVEEAGQLVGDVRLVKGNALLRRAGGLLHIEEVQAVGAPTVRPGDGHIPQHGLQGKAAEGDREGLPCGDEPALRLYPGVGGLLLLAAGKLLPEQAVVVVEAHAVPLKAQGGDGVQEAGGQPAQAAVAQGGFRLQLLQVPQLPAHGGQQLPHLPVDAQGQQIVAQQLSHQKFCGEVVELPLPRGGGPLLRQTAGQRQQRLVELPVPAGLRVESEALTGDLCKLLFQFCHGKIRSCMRMRWGKYFARFS